MVLKSIMTLLVVLSLASIACGQQLTKPNSVGKPTAKANPFQQVAVPDSVLRRINQAIKRQEKLEADNFPLYVFNLLDRKNFSFQDGLYSYKLSSPHANRRIFIVYKGATTILEGVFVNDVVHEYLNFADQNKLPPIITIRYLKAISKFLEDEYSAAHS